MYYRELVMRVIQLGGLAIESFGGALVAFGRGVSSTAALTIDQARYEREQRRRAEIDVMMRESFDRLRERAYGRAEKIGLNIPELFGDLFKPRADGKPEPPVENTQSPKPADSREVLTDPVVEKIREQVRKITEQKLGTIPEMIPMYGVAVPPDKQPPGL